MKQHFWFENEEDYRILPTSDTRIESIILGRSDGVRYFAAYAETECTELLLVDRGSVHLFNRGRSITLEEGCGALFLPGDVRGYSLPPEHEASMVCLRMKGVRGKPVQKDAGPSVFSVKPNIPAVRLSCAMLLEASQMTGRCAQEIGRNALNSLIHLVNEAQNVVPRQEKGLTQSVVNAIAYIDEHYPEGPSIEQIAASCFLSTSRLSSLMKRETGFSPFDYVIERRIGQAQQQLMYSALSVSDVAHNAGYPGLSSFSAAFHKRIGISPEGFRKVCGAYVDIAIEKRQNIAFK